MPLQHHLQAMRYELEDARERNRRDGDALSARTTELEHAKQQVASLQMSLQAAQMEANQCRCPLLRPCRRLCTRRHLCPCLRTRSACAPALAGAPALACAPAVALCRIIASALAAPERSLYPERVASRTDPALPGCPVAPALLGRALK